MMRCSVGFFLLLAGGLLAIVGCDDSVEPGETEDQGVAEVGSDLTIDLGGPDDPPQDDASDTGTEVDDAESDPDLSVDSPDEDTTVDVGSDEIDALPEDTGEDMSDLDIADVRESLPFARIVFIEPCAGEDYPKRMRVEANATPPDRFDRVEAEWQGFGLIDLDVDGEDASYRRYSTTFYSQNEDPELTVVVRGYVGAEVIAQETLVDDLPAISVTVPSREEGLPFFVTETDFSVQWDMTAGTTHHELSLWTMDDATEVADEVWCRSALTPSFAYGGTADERCGAGDAPTLEHNVWYRLGFLSGSETIARGLECDAFYVEDNKPVIWRPSLFATYDYTSVITNVSPSVNAWDLDEDGALEVTVTFPSDPVRTENLYWRGISHVEAWGATHTMNRIPAAYPTGVHIFKVVDSDGKESTVELDFAVNPPYLQLPVPHVGPRPLTLTSVENLVFQWQEGHPSGHNNVTIWKGPWQPHPPTPSPIRLYPDPRTDLTVTYNGVDPDPAFEPQVLYNGHVSTWLDRNQGGTDFQFLYTNDGLPALYRIHWGDKELNWEGPTVTHRIAVQVGMVDAEMRNLVAGQDRVWLCAAGHSDPCQEDPKAFELTLDDPAAGLFSGEPDFDGSDPPLGDFTVVLQASDGDRRTVVPSLDVAGFTFIEPARDTDGVAYVTQSTGFALSWPGDDRITRYTVTMYDDSFRQLWTTAAYGTSTSYWGPALASGQTHYLTVQGGFQDRGTYEAPVVAWHEIEYPGSRIEVVYTP